MTTYAKASPADPIHAIVRRMLEQHHGDLFGVELTVGVLWAYGDENQDHAVKLHGYPCLAVIRITPYKQRVQGIEDAVITIDRRKWDSLNEDEQDALIDHELEHLELVSDKDGLPKSDDVGRPKLKMRLHDVETGWFASVARRHGTASQEVQQATAILGEYRQTFFEWSDAKVSRPTLSAVG